MSHNIALSGVRITDLKELADVVRVVGQGQARFMPNQKTFRTYQGQSPVCDHAIVLAGSNYDIGLRRESDGSYSLLADFTMIAHGSPFRARGVDYHQFLRSATNYDQAAAQFATGALQQEYALRKAEEQAAKMGRRATRIPGKNGSITLEIMER